MRGVCCRACFGLYEWGGVTKAFDWFLVAVSTIYFLMVVAQSFATSPEKLRIVRVLQPELAKEWDKRLRHRLIIAIVALGALLWRLS